MDDKMKKISVLALFLCFFTSSLFAQNFKDGLREYEVGNYEQALQIFSKIDDQQSELFTGKTLYNLNRLHEARLQLLKSLDGGNAELQADGLYTLSMIYMIENNPAKALDYLCQIEFLGNLKGNISKDAKRQIAVYSNFLSFSQRIQVLKASEYLFSIQSVLLDGVRNETKLNAASLVQFANQLAQSHVLDENFLNELNTLYKNSITKQNNFYPNAPEGFNYSIGVLLPSADKHSESFVVSKSLYQGLQVAVEEFNATSKTNRVFLSYLNVPDTSNSVANGVFKESVDVIIGPLTSDDAKLLVPFAEEFQIPMVAPLANNDSLNIDNPYFFQMNPAFRTRGKRMAEFAVNTLHVDTVAIMVDSKTMGYLSAVAFKEEMERRNVHVAYFFAENFESTGFNIESYTQYFTSDQILKDSLGIPEIDLVYFPYTGPQAGTLIDLTLTDLEAGRSKAILLGSQDWGYIDLTPDRLAKFTIYFPDAMIVDEKSEKVIQFRQNFIDVTKNSNPDMFAILGYDLGTFVMQVIKDVKNPILFKSGLKYKPAFKGVGNAIYFNGSHVNQTLSIYKMDKTGISKVEN